ncbi:shikimate dehydrogenase [Cellulomonas sp. PS-H5]|uniref:shikimate dehydrogenase n=1 Tax=Cellulomonas sp. PS-H5 TaxID=2820400 RepID=UPI001C4FBD54|nr:shikimate dehydrogenase [Cellulomonas sp. PS-H5]MBW0255422.1 shikimate dehydrogenase [Cellulomonas sp. PS-H5]
MTGAARRAAVLGHPIAHSLSPVLHRAAYRALGLDGWAYDAVDVTEEQLPAFVGDLDAGWAGLSLTMPLKQTVLPLLDHVEPLAAVVGAVNTVLVQAGGSGRPVLTGANTDVHGIVAALSEGLAAAREPGAGASGSAPQGANATDAVDTVSGPRTAVRTAVVLGAGATAASALAALAELGCTTPVVLARSLGRTGALARAAHRMGVEPAFRTLDGAPAALAGADLLVSTLPPHAADDLAATLAGGAAPLPGAVLLDVAYDPRPTALHAAWLAAGGVAVPGERMLLHQAAEQVRLMTGRPGPLAAMDAALGSALGAAPGSPGAAADRAATA